MRHPVCLGKDQGRLPTPPRRQIRRCAPVVPRTVKNDAVPGPSALGSRGTQTEPDPSRLRRRRSWDRRPLRHRPPPRSLQTDEEAHLDRLSTPPSSQSPTCDREHPEDGFQGLQTVHVPGGPSPTLGRPLLLCHSGPSRDTGRRHRTPDDPGTSLHPSCGRPVGQESAEERVSHKGKCTSGAVSSGSGREEGWGHLGCRRTPGPPPLPHRITWTG